MRVRIPAWATGATISVNGVAAERRHDARAPTRRSPAPGPSGDTRHRAAADDTCAVEPTNDNAERRGGHLRPGRAVRQLRQHARCPALPALDRRVGHPHQHHRRWRSPPRPNGSTVNLGPFYDAHGHNYTVYWSTSGQGGGHRRRQLPPGQRRQRARARHPGHVHRRRRPGAAVGRQRHRRPRLGARAPTAPRSGSATCNSGKVLGVENMSTADNAARPAVGRQRHRRPPLDAGRRRRRHPQASATSHVGKLLGIQGNVDRAGRAGRQDPRQRHRRQPVALRPQRAPGASRTSTAAWCSA